MVAPVGPGGMSPQAAGISVTPPGGAQGSMLQRSGAAPTFPGVPQLSPSTQPGASPIPQGSTQLTPAQAEAMQKMTPEQRKAAEDARKERGDALTPDAIEALKTKPEFQGLTPQDILQGKETLEKKGAEKEGTEKKGTEKKEQEKKPSEVTSEKRVIGGEKTEQTVFERVRSIGKYQEISTVLRPYGYDFFQDSAIKVVTDRKDIPVPTEYVIGPGDEVKILLWGRVNANYNLVVDRNGNITMPQVGPIPVAGQTFEQMSKHLIKQAEQFVGANIDVTMGALKSIPIFILGDVKKPGAYTIGSFATITDALLIAGGPTGIGTMRSVQLRRKDKVITVFDLYDLLLKGDKSKDTMLQAGDVIFVPVAGPVVGIAGNVKRPAIYELKGKLDLHTLFDLAGGIIPTAYMQQIQVERIVKNERQIVVDIDDRSLTKAKGFHLYDMDLVKVFNIVEKESNVVFIHGNIKRPGKYEYKPGMRLRDIIKDKTELMPETYTNYALIKRIEPPNMTANFVPINITGLFVDQAQNIELKPQDNIYIFSKWFFKDRPFVSITGEVRKGGKFALDENMKVRDAVKLAGDLTKEAYTRKGEIVRINKKREHETIYFDINNAMAGDPRDNVLLHDEDRIIIYSMWDEKWKQDVSIAGEVKRPGGFVLTEGMTVKDIIFKAGGITRDTYMKEAELFRTDWKTKDVSIIRFSLEKALDGDAASNIMLVDHDRVVIHSAWEYIHKKSVSIDGDVLKPGGFQFAEGMTVRDLVFSAGNVLESAYLDEAEITSQIIEGDKIVKLEHKNINLKKALKGEPTDNILLKPYDRVTIKKLQDWRKDRFVTVGGEFRFPGRYITKKNEKLSSIIERAGGYADDAYLRGAFFTRKRVLELQQKSLDEMIARMEREMSSAGTTVTATSTESVQAKAIEVEQKKKLIETLKQLKPTGRMTIYLAHLRLLKGSEYDIELEEGDTLFIPTKNSVVNVAGSVMSTGSFVHSDRMGYKDYIQMAGGYSQYADTSRAFVVKVDGSARKVSSGLVSWNPFKNRWEAAGYGEGKSEIEAGDSIIVPEKLERTAWLRELKDITQIVANVGLAAGAIAVMYNTLK
ncbi:MAG: hypothetical protein C0399_09975 [Syntrophus sp. (in: bacteria)]|nr:hypothetical protein [Syntrophus sp. (in: bacteria)]MBA4418573.1 hypothetical protein [Syntrophus sp. (in: bacteria)]